MSVAVPACNFNILQDPCICIGSTRMTILTPLPDDVSADSDWVSTFISALIISDIVILTIVVSANSNPGNKILRSTTVVCT